MNLQSFYLIGKKSGFTLIEVLLSMALVGILIGVSAPVTTSFLTRQQLTSTSEQVVDQLRRAQRLSQNMEGDSQWGVYISQGQSILFRGNSYANRTIGYDEIVTFPTQISNSGITEITFSKLKGIPNPTGTITFSQSGNTKSITVNSVGVIHLQ